MAENTTGGPRKSRRHAIIVALAIIAGVVVYAYGFSVTSKLPSATCLGELKSKS